MCPKQKPLSLIMHRWKSASSSYRNGQKRSVSSSSSAASLGKNTSSFSSSGRSSVFSTALPKKSDLPVSLASSSEPKSVAIGDDHDSDFWMTDFGTSVTVNDDITRSIRAEIEDIDTSIQQIQVGIQQEECTASQLAKDVSHAQSEMSSYRRSSVELMDSASMNEQIRLDLEKTLQVDLVQPLSEAPSRDKDQDGGGDDDGNDPSNNNKENQLATDGDNGKSMNNNITTKKFIQHTKSRAESIFRSGQSTAIAKAKAECKVLEDEIASIEQRIQTENLPQLLEQKREETKARSQDLEAETSRKQTVQAAIQQCRTRCGGFAQDITDKVRIILQATASLTIIVQLSRHFHF